MKIRFFQEGTPVKSHIHGRLSMMGRWLSIKGGYLPQFTAIRISNVILKIILPVACWCHVVFVLSLWMRLIAFSGVCGF